MENEKNKKNWHPDLTEEQILEAYSRDIYEPVGQEYMQFLRELGINPNRIKTRTEPAKKGEKTEDSDKTEKKDEEAEDKKKPTKKEEKAGDNEDTEKKEEKAEDKKNPIKEEKAKDGEEPAKKEEKLEEAQKNKKFTKLQNITIGKNVKVNLKMPDGKIKDFKLKTKKMKENLKMTLEEKFELYKDITKEEKNEFSKLSKKELEILESVDPNFLYVLYKAKEFGVNENETNYMLQLYLYGKSMPNQEVEMMKNILTYDTRGMRSFGFGNLFRRKQNKEIMRYAENSSNVSKVIQDSSKKKGFFARIIDKFRKNKNSKEVNLYEDELEQAEKEGKESRAKEFKRKYKGYDIPKKAEKKNDVKERKTKDKEERE